MQSETILFNPSTKGFCVLNPSAALVWSTLESPQPAAVLATQLCHSFSGVTEEQARLDVETVLREFESLELVEAIN